VKYDDNLMLILFAGWEDCRKDDRRRAYDGHYWSD